MRSLIDDLLEYSRAGVELRIEPVDLEDVVREATRRLGTAVAESGARITTDRLPVVQADRAGLVQVLTNLISNAIKYAVPGEAPRIDVTVRQGAYMWVVAVRDHGLGIAGHQHDRVFRIFQRLHGREIPGTGIGLAICRKVMERHGGRIRIAETDGPGTTFELMLPEAAMLPG
jgi:signal transduction histidine kinase